MSLINIVKKTFIFQEAKLCYYLYKVDLSKEIIWGNVIFLDEINKALFYLLSKDSSLNKDKIRRDMVRAYLINGIDPNEYVVLDFINKNRTERASYLSCKEKDLICLSKKDAWEAFYELEDKANFYNLFKEFFKRELIEVKNQMDLDQFSSFVKRHRSFIFKPNNSHSGKGIKIIRDVSDKDIEPLFSDLLNKWGSFILEELIVQSDFMKSWNSSSVNSVRFMSIRNKQGIHIFHPYFKFGAVGKEIDNSGSGGYCIAIDPNTGSFISNAYNSKGEETYKEHPNKGTKILGTVIPEWSELLLFAKLIHEKMSFKHHYVAFDFAHTDNGWVLIEGNWGMIGYLQAITGGCRAEFKELMSETI